MRTRLAAAVVISCVILLLAACANPVPVSVGKTLTVSAASGQSACGDLATTHLLVLIQAQVLIVSEGSHATDDTGWISELQADANGAPVGLAAPINSLLSTVQAIQADNTVSSSDGTLNAAGSISSYCRTHGYPVPPTSE